MNYEYLQDSTGTYLKKIGTEDSLEERIMLYQEIPGFLPFEVRWVNGKKETWYDVTGRVSLRQFLQEEPLKIERIQSLFLQIFQMEKVLEEYLLDGSSLVIGAEYLFVERKTGKLWGIYDPEVLYKGMNAISRLLEEIMDSMDAQNSELSTLIYRMHKATKESDCTRELLRDMLEKSSCVSSGEPIKESTNRRSNSAIHTEKKLAIPTRNIVEKTSYLPSFIIMGMGCISFLFLWQGGYLNNSVSGMLDTEKVWGAFLFFLIVAGYGVWKTLPEKREKDKLIEYSEENRNNKKVCLISKWGKQEPILITTFPYRFGKDSELVHQVIDASEISPIHARLEQEGLEIYVVDEESAQGTFKNGARLVPFCKTILRDGDVLQLGKEEYVVEIT